MRKPILVFASLAMLALPSVAFAQDDDFLADLDASREPFCKAMATEFGIDQSACEQYLEQERQRFMVMDMDVFTASETSSSAASDEPVTHGGTGPTNTARFALSGGDYYVTIGDLPCPVNYFDLEGPGGYRPSLTQSGYLYDIEPGEYYWHVNTGATGRCKWSITIEPL